jgi:hypothetical protein
MITQSPTPAANRVGRGPVSVPRVRSIAALVVLSFAILTASAQAHTGDASATCNSVTITWTKFAASGDGNNSTNAPKWTIVFSPAGGGGTTTKTGTVSFQGTSFSHTEPIPGGNGSVFVTSSWTSNDTRDHNANSFSRHLTIANCPVIVPSPPGPPPPVTRAQPTLSTTASTGVALGGSIHDTATLSGGSSPTGTITFALYAASDTTCSTVLSTGTVPVNGAGNYASPEVMPGDAGSYQWVASYSGDAGNLSAATACNDPAEQSTVATQLVLASCVPSPVVLRGLAAKVRQSLSVHVTALGVKSVTFYLDGRKLKTVTKAKNQRYAIKVSARGLGYGRHRLEARVKMRNATCSTAAARAAFVKVRPAIVRRPQFTG